MILPVLGEVVLILVDLVTYVALDDPMIIELLIFFCESHIQIQ